MELPQLPEPKPSSGNAGVVAPASNGGSGLVAPPVAVETDNRLDHRQPGQWASRYGSSAWVQIVIEFAYLVLMLLTCTVGLIWIGYHVAPSSPDNHQSMALFGIDFTYPKDRRFLLWMSIGFSGMIGGSCFALKWLYHSVAKGMWNRDRVLWRLIVPILSESVAVFVSMLVASGILSLVDSRFISNFYGACGLGWLIGYFSDNVLASLQKLAHKWFGTVDDPKGSAGTTPGSEQGSA